jgi:lamin tail-like protein/NHL repeat-containing protein
MRGKKFIISLLVTGMLPFLGLPAFAATKDKISTFAGPVPSKAAGAILAAPSDVAADGSTVYIVEPSAHRVRKVLANGDISLVAGSGSAGFANGGATGATLRSPKGMTVNGPDLLIADAGNHRLRKVTGSTISTIAGEGTATWAGDGGAANLASLQAPADVVVDAGGNIYVADSGNHRIRKITPGPDGVLNGADDVITTYAGTGNAASSGDGGTADLAELDTPKSLAINGSYLYVAEQSSIRRIELSSGMISTLAAVAVSAIAVDSGENVYAADAAGRVVKVIDSAGSTATFAGSGASGSGGDGGPALNADFMQPSGVALTSDGLLIADGSAGRVRRISGGTITAFAGMTTGCAFGGDGGPATNAAMGPPTAVATDDDSNVYFADTCNGRIRKVTVATITTIGGNGTFGDSGDGGPATLAQLGGDVAGLAVAGDKDANRIVYISDTANNRVRKIAGGTISNVLNVTAPQGLAVYGADLFVATGCSVLKVTGSTATTFAGNGSCGSSGDGGPATAAGLHPKGLVVDSLGRLLIADDAASVVRRVELNGTIMTVVGLEAGLSSPSGVAVGLGGVIYIADQGNHRIRRVRGDGIIEIVAGTGTPGFSGDSGPGALAAMSSPNAIAFFPTKKNLYVSDGQNRRVRLIELPDQNPPVLSVTTVPGSINTTNMNAVPVSGTTEKSAAVRVTATDGTLNPDGTPKTVTSNVATANTTGGWSATFDASSLVDGPITISANAVDADGNSNAATSATSPVKDTVNSSTDVSNLKATAGSGQITLSWTNPASDFSGVEVRMKPGASPPANLTEGTLVALEPSGIAAKATGLENCADYSFAVFSRDTNGNVKIPGVSIKAQPLASTKPATALRFNLYPTVVQYGESVTIAGSLVWAATSAPIADAIVIPQVHRKGTPPYNFSNIVAEGIRTAADGTFLLPSYKPAWSADYRIRYLGGACSGSATSGIGTVAVRPTLTGGLTASSVLLGGSANFTGTISPSQYGQPIYLQQLVNGNSWRNIATAGLWGSGSSYNFLIRPKVSGRSWYRVFKPADADNAGAFTPGAQQLSAVRVVIAGILSDPPGSNDDLRLNEEYLTLKNTGSVPVDLYKWRLYGTVKNKYQTLPHYTLNPGASVRCHSGAGTSSAGHLYLNRAGGYWHNKHDTAHLFDPRGYLASSFRY